MIQKIFKKLDYNYYFFLSVSFIFFLSYLITDQIGFIHFFLYESEATVKNTFQLAQKHGKNFNGNLLTICEHVLFETKNVYEPILEKCKPYYSQYGLIFDIYYFLFGKSNFSLEFIYNFLRYLNSWLLALTLGLYCLSIKINFNKIIALLLFLFILFSPVFNLFGPNIYYVSFLIWAPFTLSWYFNKINKFLFFFIYFILILLNCLLGYEFINCIAASVVPGMIYFLLKDQYKIFSIVKYLLISFFIFIFSFLVSVILWVWKIMKFTNENLSQVYERMAFTVLKNSSGYEGYKEIDVTFSEYLVFYTKYLLSQNYDGFLPINYPLLFTTQLNLFIITILIFFSFYLKKIKNNFFNLFKVGNSYYLAIIFFLCFLFSNSYLAIMWVSSLKHLQMNWIVFFIPYNLFLYLVLSVYVYILFKDQK